MNSLDKKELIDLINRSSVHIQQISISQEHSFTGLSTREYRIDLIQSLASSLSEEFIESQEVYTEEDWDEFIQSTGR